MSKPYMKIEVRPLKDQKQYILIRIEKHRNISFEQAVTEIINKLTTLRERKDQKCFMMSRELS